MGEALLESIEAAWPHAARQTAGAWARERFYGEESLRRSGLPKKNDETWQHTPLSTLFSTAFAPAEPVAPLPKATLDALVRLLDLDEFALVFVDGYLHVPGESQALPAGFHVKDLRGEGRLPPEFAQAPEARERFESVNRSLVPGAWLLSVDEGVAVDRPVHLVNLHRGASAPSMSHGRCYLRLGRGSSLSLLSTHAALPGAAGGFSTHALHVYQEAESHLKWLHASGGALEHSGVQCVTVHQKGASTLDASSVMTGTRLSRLSLECLLDGEGAEATLRGLYVLEGARHADTHVRLRHAKPRGTSKQAFRGVLGGESHGVFAGKVIVDPGAQGTDAAQSNRNLLLSPGARMDTRPQLEIFNNDVKCSHGATTGQLREEELFYLQSRGIPREQARQLLAAGFVEELVGAVPEGRLRAHARAWLSGLGRFEGAGNA